MPSIDIGPISAFPGAGNLGDADVELYLNVLREASTTARQRYAGSSFDVILWDGRKDRRLEVITHYLKRLGVGVHLLTAIIPDFNGNTNRYLLGPHDGHPNPLMHERLADYVSRAMSGRR